MQIRALGYVRFRASDVGAWQHFGSDLLGLESAADDSKSRVSFRLDNWSARIVVDGRSDDHLDAVGWEMSDLRALVSARQELEQAGVAVKELSAEEVEDRRVEAGFAFDDPSGNRLELIASPRVSTRMPSLKGVSGFLTGDRGLGHVVLPVSDLETAFEFYTGVLGFRHRDSMLVQPHSGTPYRMRFLGCNKRHHSVALTEASSPTGIRHLMINAATVTDVGMAFDRCQVGGARLRTAIGQHSNDEMVSFYVAAPGGAEIEFASLGIDVDDSSWSVRELEEFKLWGYGPIG